MKEIPVIMNVCTAKGMQPEACYKGSNMCMATGAAAIIVGKISVAGIGCYSGADGPE